MNMPMQNFLIVVFLATMLSNCNKDRTNEVDDLATVKNNIENNDPSKEQKSNSTIDPKKLLDEAINALNNVAEEFHWRDTHILIQESRDALSEGDLELSIELSKKVIQQTKLMIEQKEFANDNWHLLIPVVDAK
jgi:hypothetical protein